MTYHYLDVESPLQSENPEDYGDRLRAIMGEKMGIPLSNLSFENGMIYGECKRLGQGL